MKTVEKTKPNGTVAATQWTDLYVRHNLQDTGRIPTDGSVDHSPDIIPSGNRPYSQPEQLITDSNWSKDVGTSAYADQANYIYLRGANLNPSETRSGRAYLYYCPASLLLWPSLWSKNSIATSDGRPDVKISAAPGQRFVSENPFLWIPRTLTGDTYSLIARLETPQNPNPIPPDGGISNFAKYVSEHPDMGWRGVTTFNPSAPRYTFSVDYYQGQEACEIFFALRCTNVPNGSAVTFSAGSPGPDPAIIFPWTTVQNPSSGSSVTYGIRTFVPANYQSKIVVTWDSRGTTPLPGMQLQLDAVYLVPSNADKSLIRFARPLEAFGFTGEERGKLGIRVGGYRAEAGPRYSGAPRSGITRPEATSPSIHLTGLSFVEREQSVVSNASSTTGLTLTTTPTRGADAETLTLGNVPPTPGEPDADLYYDMEFSNADNAGTTQVVLTTTSVPLGAEIWFTSLDGSVPIETAPTKIVTEPYFSVSSFVELGTDYSAKIRAYLRLNGKPLPQDWNLRFEAILIAPTEPEAQMPKPVVLTNADPKPGTLLGRVTVTN